MVKLVGRSVGMYQKFLKGRQSELRTLNFFYNIGIGTNKNMWF